MTVLAIVVAVLAGWLSLGMILGPPTGQMLRKRQHPSPNQEPPARPPQPR